jgi:hypothetical protein
MVRINRQYVREVCDSAKRALKAWHRFLEFARFGRCESDAEKSFGAGLKKALHNALAECCEKILAEQWFYKQESAFSYIDHVECEDEDLTYLVREFFMSAYKGFLNECDQLIPALESEEAFHSLRKAWESAKVKLDSLDYHRPATAADSPQPHQSHEKPAAESCSESSAPREQPSLVLDEGNGKKILRFKESTRSINPRASAVMSVLTWLDQANWEKAKIQGLDLLQNGGKIADWIRKANTIAHAVGIHIQRDPDNCGMVTWREKSV